MPASCLVQKLTCRFMQKRLLQWRISAALGTTTQRVCYGRKRTSNSEETSFFSRSFGCIFEVGCISQRKIKYL